jgi:hypothetical protein
LRGYVIEDTFYTEVVGDVVPESKAIDRCGFQMLNTIKGEPANVRRNGECPGPFSGVEWGRGGECCEKSKQQWYKNFSHFVTSFCSQYLLEKADQAAQAFAAVWFESAQNWDELCQNNFNGSKNNQILI